jgi:drug/metabolite transporter (DMT)-like permease
VPASPTSPRERQGVLLCVLAAGGFASMAVLAKLAYAAGANVVTLLSVRFAIAAVALWAIALHRGVAGLAGATRAALLALGLGLVLYSAESALFYTSLTYLDASIAELVLFSYPALVVLGAVALRREAISRRKLGALALASTGITLVLAGGQAGALQPLGIALAFAAAILYTTYVLCADSIGRALHPITFAALLCTGAALSFSVFGAGAGSLDLGMPAAAWGWAAAIAIGSTVVAMTAFLAGVARLGPGRASILSALEPPLAVAAACAVFGDQLGPLQLLGGGLVVGAIVVLQVRPRRRPALAIASGDRGPAVVPAPQPSAGSFALVTAGRRDVGV